MTRTLRVTRSGCGRGTTIGRSADLASTAATSSMFSASRRKSSSSAMVSAKSSTRAGGLASAVTGIRPTSSGASQLIAVEVLTNERGDARALDLDDYRFARAKCGGVNLGDRCGRKWDRVECAEHLEPEAGRGPASTIRRTAAKVSGGTWSLQRLELGDELGGEDPLARREDLAELDEGRTEILERQRGACGTARHETCAVPFRRRSISHHAPIAQPSLPATASTRPAGGRRRLLRQCRYLACTGIPAKRVEVVSPREVVGVHCPRFLG